MVQIILNAVEMERFMDKVTVTDNCWEWQGAKYIKGYGAVKLRRVRPSAFPAHRIMLMQSVDVPDDMCVCHKCDNPACVRPEHLFLGTLTDNNRDMWDKGRHYFQNSGKHMLQVKGSKNPNSKLTEEQVIQIRATSGNSASIAARYGVSSSMIRHIRNGRNW